MKDYKTQANQFRHPSSSDFWKLPSEHWKGGGKPHCMQCDFETYSNVDISECGSYRYIEDDSFEPLMLAVAFDDEQVIIIDLASGENVPSTVWAALFDDEIIKTAWNAQFERTVFGRMLQEKLSPDSWQCTMVWAASLSLPLALKRTAEVLNTGEQKDKAGEALIRYFSLPCRPTKANGGRCRNLPEHAPDDWQRFKEYCKQDVRTERAIRKRLQPYPMSDHEWDYYHMDQRINDRGVLIDTQLVQQAIACNTALSERMKSQAVALSGLENPNSVTQLKRWLSGQGISVESLSKKDVAALINELGAQNCSQNTIDLLKLRLQMAKSSVKKYEAAERSVCQDGRARGLFQFNGANRTGRFAGRIIQLQNLPQNHISTLNDARDLLKIGSWDMLDSIYGNTSDILSQLLRTMLIPSVGSVFVIADFSAIEARVLAWLAGENWRLDAFANGKDIYCESASQMFGVPVVKHGINGELRQKGKVAELACGYGGSTGALIAMGATEMGLREEELLDIIRSWRNANPNIVSFWHKLEEAAIDVVTMHSERSLEKINLSFKDNTMWIQLPSGRKLAYRRPKLQPNRFGQMSITYDGQSSSGVTCREETYAGKLTENCTQAIARDILLESMWRLERAGYTIVGHVHDEVIIEAPKDKASVAQVCAMMNQVPQWAEAMPLASAGYIGEDYYYKD